MRLEAWRAGRWLAGTNFRTCEAAEHGPPHIVTRWGSYCAVDWRSLSQATTRLLPPRRMRNLHFGVFTDNSEDVVLISPARQDPSPALCLWTLEMIGIVVFDDFRLRRYSSRIVPQHRYLDRTNWAYAIERSYIERTLENRSSTHNIWDGHHSTLARIYNRQLTDADHVDSEQIRFAQHRVYAKKRTAREFMILVGLVYLDNPELI